MRRQIQPEGTPAERQCITDLVVRLLNATPVDIRRTTSPDAWMVDLAAGRSVVVKRPGWLNRAGSPGVEAWAYRECARRGIRTPTVLAYSIDPECLIVESFRGTSLPEATPSMSAGERAIWARAGEDLRAIHAVQLSGFGPLVPRTDEPAGSANHWCPFVDYASAEGIPWLVDEGFLSSRTAELLLRRFEEAMPLINAVTEGRLLHGDLQGEHIFAAAGTYEGIIDFGQAQAGDPRWDLARVRLWDGAAGFDALLAGYGTDTLMQADRELLLPIYLLSLVVHHAVGHDQPGYVRRLLDRSGYRCLL